MAPHVVDFSQSALLPAAPSYMLPASSPNVPAALPARPAFTGGVHFALTKSLGGMHAAPVTAAALLDG